MSKRVRKLDAVTLKKMIQEEAARLQTETSDPVAAGVEKPEKVKAEEVDADEYADSLEKDIDFVKALKIQEKMLRTKLAKIKEAKAKLGKRITDKI